LSSLILKGKQQAGEEKEKVAHIRRRGTTQAPRPHCKHELLIDSDLFGDGQKYIDLVFNV
jgi:hypothetical protein